MDHRPCICPAFQPHPYMADWWEPTPENYLSHVSKDQILEVVGESVSPRIAQTLTKMKKGGLVESANAKLSGLRWLPDNLKVEAPQE